MKLEPCVLARLLFTVWLGIGAALVSSGLLAADPRPVVGPGASKEEVLAAYGWPTGQSQSGAKEILNYPQGQVTLANGRVERVDFNMNMPWPAPRPRPGAPSATSAKKREEPLDFWLTSFEEAAREAARRNARILALFTGSDWSPASKRFQDDVAFQPEFVNAFTADFVFLRLDLPNRTPLARELREQNTALRERYRVTTYPALLVLTPGGRLVGTVDLVKEQPGANYRERVIAAVREVRDGLLARPPAPDPLPDKALASAAADAAVENAGSPNPGAGTAAANMAEPDASPLSSARVFVVGAVAAGAVIAVVALWLLWRSAGARLPPPRAAASLRISDAANGVPTPAAILGWSRDKLCHVVAGIAETDGYTASVLPPGGDVDVTLQRKGEPRPRVLVLCVPGSAGAVSVRRAREVFGSMTVEGVANAWLVAPAGFGPDVAAYGPPNGITLLDAPQLAAQLRNLSPLLVARVMSRGT